MNKCVLENVLPSKEITENESKLHDNTIEKMEYLHKLYWNNTIELSQEILK